MLNPNWVAQYETLVFRMIMIDDAWSNDTVLQMFEAIDSAKTIAERYANGRFNPILCRVAGMQLMVIGSALAAITATSQLTMSTRNALTKQKIFFLRLDS